MAMVAARFAGIEITKTAEASKRESSPKAHPPMQQDLEKRTHIIPGMWLKNPRGEKVILPSDKKLRIWKGREWILIR